MHTDTFAAAVLKFATVDVLRCKSPADVLNLLHDMIGRRQMSGTPFQLLGAWRLPRRYTDWGAYVLDQTVFFHKSVSAEFWPEYFRLVQSNGSSPTGMLARLRITPFTLTEAMQLGGSRWVYDLLKKYGWRDCIYIPLGLWAVVFVTPARLQHVAADERNVWLMLGAATAFRLEALLGSAPSRPDNLKRRLTPREIAVLRETSTGRRTAKEIAAALGVKESTANTLIQRAQRKLNANSRSHAVAEAMRRQFFD